VGSVRWSDGVMGVLSCAQQGTGHLRHKSRVRVRERAWVFHPSRTRYDDVGGRHLSSVLPSEDAGGMKRGFCAFVTIPGWPD
jgi:hypothetical protein